jgi:hypothetical protein
MTKTLLLLSVLGGSAFSSFASSGVCSQGSANIVSGTGWYKVGPDSVVSMYASTSVGNIVPGVIYEDAPLNLITSNGTTICGSAILKSVSSSLFSADQTGSGLAASVIVVHPDETQTITNSVAQLSANLFRDGTKWANWTPVPIDLGGTTDVAILPYTALPSNKYKPLLLLFPHHKWAHLRRFAAFPLQFKSFIETLRLIVARDRETGNRYLLARLQPRRKTPPPDLGSLFQCRRTGAVGPGISN